MKRIHGVRVFPRVACREVAVVILIVCLAVPAALAYEREETQHKRIDLGGAKRIIVENSRGDVKLIGEKGRTDILCEYTKSVRGRDQDEAIRLFNLMDIEVTREKTDLKISVRYPDRPGGDRSILSILRQHYAGLKVDLNVSVPSGIGAEVVSASGDIELASIRGPVVITSASGDVEVVGVGDLKIDASSGDITVSDVSGIAALSASSGCIEASNIKGDMTARSASGEIVLTDLGGDLSVATVSGDVTVEGVRNVEYRGTSGSARFTIVQGAVTAITASGDIEVDAAPEAPANYEMRTSSGDVELHFSRQLKGGFVLKVRTTSGDISTSLPIAVTKVGRHYLMGVVREGKSVVVLETASGDIDVSETEE